MMRDKQKTPGVNRGLAHYRVLMGSYPKFGCADGS